MSTSDPIILKEASQDPSSPPPMATPAALEENLHVPEPAAKTLPPSPPPPESTLPPPEPLKKKRKICCCFKSWISCGIVTLLILGAIALSLYLLFPAVPSVYFGNPYIPENSPGVQINGSDPNPIVATEIVRRNRPFVLSYALATNVTIFMTSYYDIGIRNVQAEAQGYFPNGTLVPNFIGNGSVSNLKLDGRRDNTITFPVTMYYATSFVGLNQDPLVLMFNETCFATPQLPINSKVVVNLDIGFLAFFGVRPRLTFDVTTECPSFTKLLNSNNTAFAPYFEG